MNESEQRKTRTPVTYLLRDEAGKLSGLTADGLALVENLATYGKSQNYIASKLGITRASFRKLLGESNAENAARLSWERGFAIYEDKITKMMMKHAERNPIAAIYFSKVRLGWRETEPPAPAVENRINITLPAPMSTEAYYAMVGVDGPLDYRSPHAKAAALEAEEELLALPAPAPEKETTS